ncbi:hypothetical protein [Pontibacter flavimaris]|uniref:YcxB family protein n=1 Tax=Pontibacter flavimaris TaxID=1797110 RepID=A0A1Q5PI95_9BACT|nr:hypothetical protein [Pontibacter flavimaris]OKL41940.1 hypothetical protein A3841_07995 [Pontibacter flavimaris]
MQDTSIRLFEDAYTIKPRSEKRLMLLALAAMALQFVLLLYIFFSQTFSAALVLLLLLSLLVPAYFVFSVWLDRNPHYRRHLTLHDEGVCYRPRFMQAEQEFEWGEVDYIKINMYKVLFVLKNVEEHEVSLEHIQNDRVLQQVKEQVLQTARLKGIEIH